MKVMRKAPGQFARRPPHGRGCAPLFVLIVVAMAVVASGRDWIGQLLKWNRPQQATANLPAAMAAFDAGDLDMAIDYAQQILERSPLDEGSYELLIRALIYRSYSELDREADRERALGVSSEAIEKLPRNLTLQAAHGYALQANGYAEEARRIALRIVERSPDHVLARIVLSLSYGSQGLFDAALREAELGVQLADQYGQYRLESHRTLAIAYGDLGIYRRAISELDHAVSHNDKLIPLQFETALYALQISDIDQATVAYYRIMALDEDNVKVRVRLCELSNRLQERKSALRYCHEVTQLAPMWVDGWYKLGREYFLSGDYALAQNAFNQCARLQTNGDVAIKDRQLECWFLQGQSAEIRGDCAALVTIYQEFLDMVKQGQLPQTWSYPPEGPRICVTAAAPPVTPLSPSSTQ